LAEKGASRLATAKPARTTRKPRRALSRERNGVTGQVRSTVRSPNLVLWKHSEHRVTIRSRLGGKLGLNRQVFEQEKKQSEAEGEEQRLRVINSVRLFYYQSLAAQEMVDLRWKLSQVAEDAVKTSHQLGNVGQADQPDVLQAEVEGEQAELAVAAAAEQKQLRVWRGLAATVGKPELPFTHPAGSLYELPDDNPDQWLQAILQDSPAVKIAQLGVLRADASLARAKRQPIPDLAASRRAPAKPRTGNDHKPAHRFAGVR
jgi:outer membrane protein TolC